MIQLLKTFKLYIRYIYHHVLAFVANYDCFFRTISYRLHFFFFPPIGIKDLNVRTETIKLLEENIGKTLSDMNHSRILYDPPPRILEIKAKINKWDLMKLKRFCTTKENILLLNL